MITLTFVKNTDRYWPMRGGRKHGIYGPPRADGIHYAALCEVEDEALGRAMAAAPDMLEALHDLLTRPTDGAARQRARNAIAKAEGRANG